MSFILLKNFQGRRQRKNQLFDFSVEPSQGMMNILYNSARFRSLPPLRGCEKLWTVSLLYYTDMVCSVNNTVLDQRLGARNVRKVVVKYN